MKKIKSLLLSIVLVLFISSCSKDNNTNGNQAINQAIPKKKQESPVSLNNIDSMVPVYENQKYGFRIKLLKSWNSYKTFQGDKSIIFTLPTTDQWLQTANMTYGTWYYPIVTLVFYSKNEWSNYLEECKKVKKDDYWYFYCTKEWIEKSIFKETTNYVIITAHPQDAPSDFITYYTDGTTNYTDYMRSTFEEIK